MHSLFLCLGTLIIVLESSQLALWVNTRHDDLGSERQAIHYGGKACEGEGRGVVSSNKADKHKDGGQTDVEPGQPGHERRVFPPRNTERARRERGPTSPAKAAPPGSGLARILSGLGSGPGVESVEAGIFGAEGVDEERRREEGLDGEEAGQEREERGREEKGDGGEDGDGDEELAKGCVLGRVFEGEVLDEGFLFWRLLRLRVSVCAMGRTWLKREKQKGLF